MSSMQFRCEKCGKLMSVQAGHGHLVTCPHCQTLTAIPEGLASLPQPMVPGTVPPGTAAPGQTAPDELQHELAAEGENKTVAAAMPWVLSVMLHLGVGLIAGFLGAIALNPPKAIATMQVPFVGGDKFDPEDVGGIINPGPEGASSDTRPPGKKTDTDGYSLGRDRDQISLGGRDGDSASIISLGGHGDVGGLNLGGGGHGSGNGPGVRGIGGGPNDKGNAYHVIYCIDASGSMSFTGNGEGSPFEVVRSRMRSSISRLSEVQDFQVIFFQEGSPIEMPTKRLVPATPENRSAAARFIGSQTARGGGGTDPVPALNRCFDLMQTADTTRQGKQIFLLTDGAFRDNDAVLRCVRERNKAKDVHIMTYLYGRQDDESIVRLMKQIARETGGRYKNITE